MRFFEKTTREVLPGGFVDRTTAHIVEHDNNDPVTGAQWVAERAAITLAAEGWEIYWDFPETSFRATKPDSAYTNESSRYITVKAL